MRVKRLIVLLFFVISSRTQAQDVVDSLNTIQALSEVVITATRTERSTQGLPVPIQTISRETIRTSGVSRLNEVIQEQAGLVIVPDFGGGEGVQMQGLDAAYTLILIDGQPLIGRSAGTLDLSRITVSQIDRIEIVKGASSSLYGSEALAGVINIITQGTLKDDYAGDFNYKVASFNAHDFTLNNRWHKNKWSAGLLSNYFSSEGYKLSDHAFLQTVEPFYNLSIQSKISWEPSEKVSVQFQHRYYYQKQDNKAEIQEECLQGDSHIWDNGSDLLIRQRISDRLKLQYDLYYTQYETKEYLNHSSGKLFEESRYFQRYIRPEIRFHYNVGRNNILSGGIGFNKESLTRTYFSQTARLYSTYMFSQYEGFLGKKWNYLAGFRYDLHRQYRSQFSPKLALNYALNSRWSFKTSFGYGYKAPDLRQLYFDFTNSSVGYSVFGYNVANRRLQEMKKQGQLLSTHVPEFLNSLKPESSVSGNLGMNYRKKRVHAEANLFYHRIHNLIDTRVVAQKANGQNVFSYFNIDKIYTYGIENQVTVEVFGGLCVSMGYQYLAAKDQSVRSKFQGVGIYARDPETHQSFRLNVKDYFGLYNRSRHNINLKISYCIPAIRWSCYARLIYRSKYGIMDSNENNILDHYDNFVKGYLLANITTSKELRRGFGLQLGCSNLLNYTDKQNISNLPGRQVFGRITYQIFTKP